MAKRKAASKRKLEIIDYVALIERTALSYGRTLHHLKWEKPRPNSRKLYLFGRLLIPAKLVNVAFEALLFGDTPLPDEPEEPVATGVAVLHKHGHAVYLTAHVPPDFLPTLSPAYEDGRLSLLVGRGPTMFRNASVLASIDFENRAYFEAYWGEPLEPVGGTA